jgi:hypothetical protein
VFVCPYQELCLPCIQKVVALPPNPSLASHFIEHTWVCLDQGRRQGRGPPRRPRVQGPPPAARARGSSLGVRAWHSTGHVCRGPCARGPPPAARAGPPRRHRRAQVLLACEPPPWIYSRRLSRAWRSAGGHTPPRHCRATARARRVPARVRTEAVPTFVMKERASAVSQ